MGFLSKLFSKKKLFERVQAAQTPVLQAVKTQALTAYESLKAQGSAMIDSGDLSGAEQAYASALCEAPNSSEAHVNLGYVLIDLSRSTEAKLHLDKAIELDGNSFDAYLLRAMLALTELDTENALLNGKNALRINPTSPQARAVLWKALALRGDYTGIEEQVKALDSLPMNTVAFHLTVANAMSGVLLDGEPKKALLQLALAHLQAAAALDSTNTEVLYNQSLVLLALKQTSAAIGLLKTIVELNPNHHNAHYTIAIVLKEEGEVSAALECFEKLITVQPLNSDAYKNAGAIHLHLGSFSKALSSFKSALKIDADMVDVLMLLSTVQAQMGDFKSALESSQRAVTLSPGNPEVHFVLGNVLASKDKYLPAIEAYEQALRIRSVYFEAQTNYASALLGIGELDRALAMYRDCLVSQPDNLLALGNVAYCSSFDPSCSTYEYLQIAKAYGAVATRSANPFSTWEVDPLQNRPLRVGLISGDFCYHPVGFFLESVIANSDPEKIEWHAFSNGSAVDEMQASLQARFNSWTSIVGLTDQSAAKLIYAAKLDFLIDLSGFTGKNRLSLFAWRPAPVQASWLGYWASTGVAEIDYILADRHAVPPENQNQFSERVRYLPDIRYCFSPPSAVHGLPVSKPPSAKKGFVTFGCYQHMRKLTPAVLRLWGKIFALAPQSRFRLQGSGYTDEKIRAKLFCNLAAVGIPESQVTLVSSMNRLDYLKSHSEVDIILDTFPYPGGTTTCDALWMGVPTVTLSGDSMLSRQGVSLLMCADLPEWVAQSEYAYVMIAVNKSKDITGLSRLRSSLRTFLFGSPLFNAPKFSRELQLLLESMVKEKSAERLV